MNRQVKILLPVSVVIVLLLGYYSLYRPTFRRLKEFTSKLKVADAELAFLQQKVEMLPRLESKNESLRQEVEEMESKLHSEEEVTSLIRQITDVAKKTNSRVVFTDYSADEEEAPYPSINLRLRLVSKYKNIVDFYQNLNSIGKLIFIERYSIRKDVSTFPNLQTELYMKVFLKKEGEIETTELSKVNTE